MDIQSGLVLEGGGMRGVFTSGALDCFMDHSIYFPYTIGVSAGACNGLSYASRQKGRAKYSNIDLLERYKYIGWKQLLLKQNIMDFDLLFDTFPSKIIPYDYDVCFNSPERYVIVTSNCMTGKAEYLEEKNDKKRLLDICRASCSLPLLCPVAYVDGIPMLDGGVCDPIPIRHAMEEGYSCNVVILTRNRGYRKKEKNIRLPWFVYRNYPAIRACLRDRTKAYNETLDYIEQLEDEGKVHVIRPEKPLMVERLERNVQKLTDLYHEGYACAEHLISENISTDCMKRYIPTDGKEERSFRRRRADF